MKILRPQAEPDDGYARAAWLRYQTSQNATVVIVPGLRDHVAEHWQTHLAAWLPEAITVSPLEEGRLSRTAQVAALEAVVATIQAPLLFVAHSAGAITLAHWAVAHGEGRPVIGALMVAPADLESPMPAGYPGTSSLSANGWLPIPRATLPFPALVCLSSNDPLGWPDRIRQLARDWHADLVEVGDVGHLNPASGYGPWPEVLGHLETLMHR